MTYGLPIRGQRDWDDELNNSVESLRSDAEAAIAAAEQARSNATAAIALAQDAAARVDAFRSIPDAATASLVNDSASQTRAALLTANAADVQSTVDTEQTAYWVKARETPGIAPTGASRLLGQREWNPVTATAYTLTTTPTYIGTTVSVGQRDLSVDFKCPPSGTIRFVFDTFVSAEVGATAGDDVYLCAIISGEVPTDSKKVVLRRPTNVRTLTTTSATGSPNQTATVGTFRAADVGSTISRNNVPAGTTIISVTSDTTAVMSANATAGGSAVATLSTATTSGTRVQYEYVWTGLIPGATYTLCPGGYVAAGVTAKVIAGGAYGPTTMRIFEDAPTVANPFGVTAVRGADPLVTVTSDTKYNSFPGLVKCPNGDLLAGYRKATSHTTGAEGVALKRSTDNGATWSTETLLTDGAYDLATCTLSVVDTSTVALVTWLRPSGGSPLVNATRIYLSTDNGATWAAPITVDTGTWLQQWSVSESPLVKHDGYYYLGVWGMESGSAVGTYEAGIMRSADLATWTRVANFDSGYEQGFNEIGVAVFDDRLVALMRLESDYAIYESTSFDGVSWSSPAAARGATLSAPKLMTGLWNDLNLLPMRYKPFGTGTYGHGFLAALNAGGDLARIAHLEVAGAFMYGQAAMVGTNKVGVLWAAESSSSDCRIYYDEYDLTLTT